MDIDISESNLSHHQLVPPPPFAEFRFSLPSPMRELAGQPFQDFGALVNSSGVTDSMDMHNQATESPWANPFRHSSSELRSPKVESSVAPALLSLAEQNDLLGFLDRFEWEFDPVLPQDLPNFPSKDPANDLGHFNQLGLRTATSPPGIMVHEVRLFFP